MIARIWKGQTRLAQSDRYLDYLLTTGVHDLQMTEGNQGVYVLRRIEDGQAEFTFISLWESLEAVRRFAARKSIGRYTIPKIAIICWHSIQRWRIMRSWSRLELG